MIDYQDYYGPPNSFDLAEAVAAVLVLGFVAVVLGGAIKGFWSDFSTWLSQTPEERARAREERRRNDDVPF